MSPNDPNKKIPIGVFLLGLLFTAGIPVVPCATMVWEMHNTGTHKINWQLVWHQAVLWGGGVFWAYIARYKAYIKIPPFIEEAWLLRRGIIKTTVLSTGRADDPNPIITTKIEETHATPAAPVDPKPKE